MTMVGAQSRAPKLIVLDTSSIVGAALKPNTSPRLCLLLACSIDVVAMSLPVEQELHEVLFHPRILRWVGRRDVDLVLLLSKAKWFEPQVVVTDRSDADDNKYLELVIESGAHTLISCDADPLVLPPWRSVTIVTPAASLAAVGP